MAKDTCKCRVSILRAMHRAHSAASRACVRACVRACRPCACRRSKDHTIAAHSSYLLATVEHMRMLSPRICPRAADLRLKPIAHGATGRLLSLHAPRDLDRLQATRLKPSEMEKAARQTGTDPGQKYGWYACVHACAHMCVLCDTAPHHAHTSPHSASGLPWAGERALR
jgi:hypothetical protein